MSRLLLSVIIWVTAFLSLELPAHFIKSCPWSTLSSTVWDGIKWWHPVVYFVVLFGFILLGHFVFRWHAYWLVTISVLLTLAILLHLAVR